jgi:hypothetical protein
VPDGGLPLWGAVRSDVNARGSPSGLIWSRFRSAGTIGLGDRIACSFDSGGTVVPASVTRDDAARVDAGQGGVVFFFRGRESLAPGGRPILW